MLPGRSRTLNAVRVMLVDFQSDRQHSATCRVSSPVWWCQLSQLKKKPEASTRNSAILPQKCLFSEFIFRIGLFVAVHIHVTLPMSKDVLQPFSCFLGKPENLHALTRETSNFLHRRPFPGGQVPEEHKSI